MSPLAAEAARTPPEIEALIGLPRGARAGGGAPDPSLAESLRLAGSGDNEAGLALARRLAAERPDSAVAQGIFGVLLCAGDKPAEALERLEACAALAPRAAWPRALRSLAWSALGRWERALEDIERAAQGDPTPWMLGQRAMILDRLGSYQRALKDLGALARRLPGSPEPHLLAARLHQDQAQYGRAAVRLGSALRLRPGDALLYRQRARLLLLQGRNAEAARDLDRAVQLTPGDRGAWVERLWVEILRNRFASALAALRRFERAHPGAFEAPFLLGFVRARQRRYAEAAAAFDRALAPGGDADASWRSRVSYYRLAMRVLARDGGRETLEDGLYLCGLGYRHPFQAGVGVVKTLARCRVIYSNLSDPHVTEFLGLFPAPLRPVVFRRWRTQAATCARQVFEGVAEGGPVGFVTRGHPLFYGELAAVMVNRARREGVPCTVAGSVSIADMVVTSGGAAGGLHLLDGVSVKPRTLPIGRYPAVIYSVGNDDVRADFMRRLRDVFAGARACFLLAGSGGSEYAPVPSTVAEVGPALQAADSAVTLFVPAERPRG